MTSSMVLILWASNMDYGLTLHLIVIRLESGTNTLGQVDKKGSGGQGSPARFVKMGPLLGETWFFYPVAV